MRTYKSVVYIIITHPPHPHPLTGEGLCDSLECQKSLANAFQAILLNMQAGDQFFERL